MIPGRRFPLLVLLCLAGCIGGAARDRALLPAIAQAWSHVRIEVQRELEQAPNADAAAAVVAADAAIAAGSPVQVAAVRWPLLEQTALADIARRLAAGEIGPGVAESLRGRVADLAEARALFVRQTR